MKHWTPNRVMLPALLAVATAWGCSQNSTSSRPAESGDGGGAREAMADASQGDSSAEAPSYGGKAVFPETEFGFGEVDQGTKVSHVFKVRNQGEEVLHIKRVRGS